MTGGKERVPRGIGGKNGREGRGRKQKRGLSTVIGGGEERRGDKREEGIGREWGPKSRPTGVRRTREGVMVARTGRENRMVKGGDRRGGPECMKRDQLRKAGGGRSGWTGQVLGLGWTEGTGV